MSISDFVTKCLSSSGDISFGRTASALTLMFCLGWDSAFVWFSMKHLDLAHMTIHDVLPSAGALIAQAGFCTIFYGVNKASALKDNPQNGQGQ